MSDWREWRLPIEHHPLAFNWPIDWSNRPFDRPFDDYKLHAISFDFTDSYLDDSDVIVERSEVAVFKKGDQEVFACGRFLQRPDQRQVYATRPPPETLEELKAWYRLVVACSRGES